jgi:hypothetical protein
MSAHVLFSAPQVKPRVRGKALILLGFFCENLLRHFSQRL